MADERSEQVAEAAGNAAATVVEGAIEQAAASVEAANARAEAAEEAARLVSEGAAQREISGRVDELEDEVSECLDRCELTETSLESYRAEHQAVHEALRAEIAELASRVQALTPALSSTPTPSETTVTTETTSTTVTPPLNPGSEGAPSDQPTKPRKYRLT